MVVLMVVDFTNPITHSSRTELNTFLKDSCLTQYSAVVAYISLLISGHIQITCQ